MSNSAGNGTPTLLSRTKKLLRQSGLRARKSLGQHFLIDDDVLHDILAAAALSPKDTVIEVGPGLGILTAELAARAGWVIAIELDDNLAEVLRKTMPGENVVIVNENVLGTDPRSLLNAEHASFPYELSPYKVVANLPYYITAPVLRHFLEASVKPEMLLVMVQQEVAESIVGGGGRNSLLGIAVQLYGKPYIVRKVPPEAFYPAPEVASAVLKIDVYPEPAVDVHEQGFFELVRAGFTANRKQAANSLSQGLGCPREDAQALLEKAGLDPKRRTETFTLEEWAALWRVYDGEQR